MIRDIIIDLELLEFDLFKDITIPDVREKLLIRNTPQELQDMSADKATIKNQSTNIVLTLTSLKEIQEMFSYENDYEILDRAFISRAPKFKFIEPSREVI